MKILLTDPHTRTALASARALSAIAEIHVAQVRGASLASKSRHVRAVHHVPDPERAPDGFLSALAALVQSAGIDVLLPLTDVACRIALPARERFAPAVVAGPSAEAFRALSDKASAGRLALRLGMTVPHGGPAESLEDAEQIARELGYPVIVKPVESAVLERGGGMRRGQVLRVDSRADLASAWERSAGVGAGLVQQLVPGRGEGLFVLRWGGETRAAFAHRRLREKPPEGGVSTLRESIAIDAKELACFEALLDELRFEGVAMAEYRTDGRTRWLIEFNARLWGSLQLSIDAGVNFPRLLVEAATGRAPTRVPDYRVGVRSRWLLGDLDHAILLARGATGPSGESGLSAALSVLLRSAGPTCRAEVLRAEDPLPFAAELCAWTASLARSLRLPR